MAESTIVKNMRDGTLTIRVGVNTYTIKYEEGTLQLNVPGPTIANYLDRGKLADTLHGQPQLRYDQDQPMSGSFTAYLRDLSDGSYITAEEFIFKSGQYLSAWGTTMGASGEVKTVDLLWDVAGTAHGDAANHQALLQWCSISGAVAEGSPNKSTLNYTSYDLYPTVT